MSPVPRCELSETSLAQIFRLRPVKILLSPCYTYLWDKFYVTSHLEVNPLQHTLGQFAASSRRGSRGSAHRSGDGHYSPSMSAFFMVVPGDFISMAIPATMG